MTTAQCEQESCALRLQDACDQVASVHGCPFVGLQIAHCKFQIEIYDVGVVYSIRRRTALRKKNGVGEVGFASQKNYISLYILKESVVAAHRARLAGLSVGKGCIRYSKPEKIDFSVVEQLLIATRDSAEEPC